MPKKIGEGSYGCVHKPSLRCKNKKVDYTNKVSKIMTKKHSRTEMQEYAKIQEVDKSKQFYLGKPVLCVPENDDSAKQAVDMCERFKGNQIQNYNLLIMSDGGDNLQDYANRMRYVDRSPENIEKIEKFWIEAQRILLGLTIFNDNGIVHHDLKPQNIVYNEDANRTNFIDFGLMTTMDIMQYESNVSRYRLGRAHWSFPLEMDFINKYNYLEYARLSDYEKSHCLNFLSLDNDVIKTFLHYVTTSNNKTLVWNEIRVDYCNLINSIHEDNYDEFLERVMRTIDVYGTGMAFMYVLNKTRHLIGSKLEKELRTLFYNMVNPNVFERYMPNQVLNSFETILFENGILTKYNKHFENHKLVNDKPIINNIPNKPNSIFNVINNNIKEQNVNRILDTLDITPINKPNKICPPGKELNPFTRRCVNPCKYGYMRNSSFKCVRDKGIKLTKTQKSSKTIKIPKTRKIQTPVDKGPFAMLGI
jgi:serine/threonine protein kinase